MEKVKLGTKRVCPETNKKFYDLGKSVIISPYTGKEYHRSFFENNTLSDTVKTDNLKNKVSESDDNDIEIDDDQEFVSLEEAESVDNEEEDIPEIDGSDIIIENSSDESDNFLEEDDDDTMIDVVVSVDKDGEN